MLKKLKFFFIIFLFSYCTNSFSENNILFIDIEFIYLNSNAGKIVNEKVKSETQKINDEFTTYQKKIKDERGKLINQKNILSQDELKKKSIELEAKIKEYNKIISTKNNKLVEYKNSTKIEFLKSLSKIVQDYATNNSIEMIIKKDNILIGKNNLDATNDVLVLFNKNIKSIESQ